MVRNHRYRTTNLLGTFDKILAGHGEESAYIDGFHLDLYGTFMAETISNFKSVLPLVLKSRGRCLAITIADARRNMILERWPEYQKRGDELFGGRGELVYEDLLRKQHQIPISEEVSRFAKIKPFDPEKAAKREFGLLIELAEMLTSQRLDWRPVTIERYVYVSRSSGRPFRMRTYMFHFGRRGFSLPVALAEPWIHSKLFFANEMGFKEVTIPTVCMTKVQMMDIEEKGEKNIMSKPDFLELSGYVAITREEYNVLVEKGKKFDAVATQFGMLFGTNGTQLVAPVATPDSNKQSQSPLKGRKNYQSFSSREKIEWQIKTLETKASSGGKWQNGQWENLLKEEFGIEVSPDPEPWKSPTLSK